MTALPTLITDAEVRATALKAAADNFVLWLNNMRNDIAKVEAELADKRRFADAEIARLRSQIDELKRDHASAERELAQVRAKIEHERKEIGRERANLLKTIDNAFTPAA
jgi:predicted  nucleic acid-binding Zn-ribbon protein